jgi:hypothetical protein
MLLFTLPRPSCDLHDGEPATTIGADRRRRCSACTASHGAESGWLSMRWIGEPPNDETLERLLEGLIVIDERTLGIEQALRYVLRGEPLEL